MLDLASMRALGFCVSVAHAEFMAASIQRARVSRRRARQRQTPLRLNASSALQDLQDTAGQRSLFAVDLFNEGLDLPEVDTVLFLRPTESATVFLQQLGPRACDRTADKPVLTVLDFVGYHRKEFRFDLKLRALTGQTRRGLERDIERGFPFLPVRVPDCDGQEGAGALCLRTFGLRSQTVGSRSLPSFRSYGDQDLGTFLDESGIELSDILRRGSHSWTRLRRDAGLETRDGSVLEAKLLKRIRAFAHIDDCAPCHRVLEPALGRGTLL